jgi:peptidoglycan hydrolase-like protein with peptidoglycan-binding domain
VKDPILCYDYLYDSRLMKNRILRLQRMLRVVAAASGDDALNTAENGSYDASTRAAVMAFQKRYGIPVSGRVDLETWEMLRQAWEYAEEEKTLAVAPFSPERGSIREGEESELVRLLQEMLDTLRQQYDTLGAVPKSGRYDMDTANAVRAFQRAATLAVTGETDKTTWNRIAAEYNRIEAENP